MCYVEEISKDDYYSWLLNSYIYYSYFRIVQNVKPSRAKMINNENLEHPCYDLDM